MVTHAQVGTSNFMGKLAIYQRPSHWGPSSWQPCSSESSGPQPPRRSRLLLASSLQILSVLSLHRFLSVATEALAATCPLAKQPC